MNEASRIVLADILKNRESIATGPILEAMERVNSALSDTDFNPSDEFVEYAGTLSAWLAGSAGAMMTNSSLMNTLGLDLVMNMLAMMTLIVLLDVYHVSKHDVSLDGMTKEDVDWLNRIASNLGSGLVQ